ncbi:hypothetical protein [Pseudomonas chlororaphis]|uniref:hypothetical protein n=1 Tax=Pseudomonas chlororaphis TaxID=587753 RepID=UPI002366C76F|nr:hypothetical protein [Pseudomonas chlororaphis]WDH22458.1 hypothetical protein PUP50_31615 [Pseudomonas chlororaphis]
MSESLNRYYEALARLTSGANIRTPKGVKITNDAVSLEAGLGKGSIKKSRTIYSELIATIDEARREQSKPVMGAKEKLDALKKESAKYQADLEAALGREVALLREVYQLKQELAKLIGASVVPIRGSAGLKK